LIEKYIYFFRHRRLPDQSTTSCENST